MYKKSIEDIEKILSEHIAFLDKYYDLNKFIFSGRCNLRNGGIILINSEIKDEVETIINEDSFNQNRLSDYEIIGFFSTKYDGNFETYIKKV